jgi:cystathionine beta-lyase
VAPLRPPQEGWLIRLHVGLEDPDDLLADVMQALAVLPAQR